MRNRKGKFATIKATIHIECNCGYVGAVKWGYPEVHVIPEYTNDSGTSWPAEYHITCPHCGGTDEYPLFQ
jgi:hypothetical protein